MRPPAPTTIKPPSVWNPPTPTPTPGPSAPPPSYNPYQSDPGYQQALQRQQVQSQANNQALQNLISQRLIAYGDSGLAGQYGGDAAAAAANTTAGNSELARINQTHSQAQQAMINRLAAHGIIFSGETGYQTGQENQNYGHNIYNAQQRLLADILGYRQQNLAQNQSLQDQVNSALEAAWQNYTQNPALYGTGQVPQSGSAQGLPTPQQTSNANAMIDYIKGKGYFG